MPCVKFSVKAARSLLCPSHVTSAKIGIQTYTDLTIGIVDASKSLQFGHPIIDQILCLSDDAKQDDVLGQDADLTRGG